MFKNMLLGKKIGFSFALVIFFLMVAVIFSGFALKAAYHGVDEYRYIARTTNLAGRIQANMLAMRMAVKNFMLYKQEDSVDDYNARYNTTSKLLSESKGFITDKQDLATLSQITQSLSRYHDDFNQAIALINNADTINSNVLSVNGEVMRENLTDIIASEYSKGNMEVAFAAAKTQESLLSGRIFVLKFLDSAAESDYNKAITFLKEHFSPDLTALAGKMGNSALKADLQRTREAFSEYLDSLEQIEDVLNQSNNLVANSLDVIGPKISDLSEALKLSAMAKQDLLGPELKDQIENGLIISVIVAFIAVVLGSLISLYLTKNITRPIKVAVDAANELAKGNLVITVEKTHNDETGILLDAVKATADKLKDMIATISRASYELASASEELAAVTEQTAKGISRQESETDMVAVAMNEMTMTVRDIANNAAQAAQAANSANDEASQGTATLNDTTGAISNLARNVNDSSVELNHVQDSVKSIGDMINVIQGIADQTNLLALNAAIEAASAGEQGRGFAVVADEVRSLASRTQNSTQEIHTIITQLQSATHKTVEVMNVGITQADACEQQIKQTSAAITKIMASIEQINDMTLQIASASEEQSSVSESINENVVNVKNISQENAIGANQTKTASMDISRLASQLNGLVAQFSV